MSSRFYAVDGLVRDSESVSVTNNDYQIANCFDYDWYKADAIMSKDWAAEIAELIAACLNQLDDVGAIPERKYTLFNTGTAEPGPGLAYGSPLSFGVGYDEIAAGPPTVITKTNNTTTEDFMYYTKKMGELNTKLIEMYYGDVFHPTTLKG